MPGITKTPKARALGAALRDEREKAGVRSQRKMAALIERDQSSISRWESGERTPDPADVAQYITALGVTGSRYDEIVAMASHADAPSWMAMTLPEQRVQLAALLKFERDARRVTDIAPLLIPGVLQTADYTRVIMESDDDVTEEEIDTRVAVRIGRRDLITRDNPATLAVFLGEAALRQIVGSPKLMAKQIRYAMEMSEYPNINIRVMPLSAGWHPGLEGGFLLIESRTEDPIVHLELRGSSMFLHEPHDIGRYKRATEVVEQLAMSPTESYELMTSIAHEMETTE